MEDPVPPKKKQATALQVLSGALERDDEAEGEGREIQASLEADIIEQLKAQQHSAHPISDSDEEDEREGAASSGTKPLTRWLQPKQTSGPRVGKAYQAELPPPA